MFKAFGAFFEAIFIACGALQTFAKTIDIFAKWGHDAAQDFAAEEQIERQAKLVAAQRKAQAQLEA